MSLNASFSLDLFPNAQKMLNQEKIDWLTLNNSNSLIINPRVE